LIDDDSHSQLMGSGQESLKILQRAEDPIDVAVIADVVAEVPHGRKTESLSRKVVMLSRVNAYEWYEYVCSGIVKVRDQISIRLYKIHNTSRWGGRGYCRSVGEQLRGLKKTVLTREKAG
jgi:hypothetical protein